MPMVSDEPGSPLSVITTWRAAPPSMETGASGFVMSWMLAFPLNVALAGGSPLAGTWVAKDVIALPLIWYACPLLRTIVLMLPCRFVPDLLYLTLKPKLVF